MVIAKIKKWGNSLGLIIPKEEVNRLNLKDSQEVIVKIEKKENPLRELFGTLKFEKSTEQIIKENRKMLESKWI